MCQNKTQSRPVGSHHQDNLKDPFSMCTQLRPRCQGDMQARCQEVKDLVEVRGALTSGSKGKTRTPAAAAHWTHIGMEVREALI